MAANETADPSEPPSPLPQVVRSVATPLARIRWLVAVVAVIVLLTAGWPLLNNTVSDNRPLPAGHSLTIGPGGAYAARITIGRGFALLPADSNPRQQYSMRVGQTQLTVSSVSLPAPMSAARLWAGLRRVLSLNHPGATLGKLMIFANAQGQPGVTGPINDQGEAGMAGVFVAPTGKFVVALVFLAPRSALKEMRDTGQQLMRSVTFLGTGPVLQSGRGVAP